MITASHPLLNPHQTIAWDMDGTLVDGPNSSFFRHYIHQNPQKIHHIVTFRDPDWAAECLDELKRHGLPPWLIRSIRSCPQDLWRVYAQSKVDLQEWVNNPPRDFAEAEQLCHGDLRSLPKLSAYLHWKGLASKELGCSVLIDDMKLQVIMGCTAYGIKFVDALDPTFDIRAQDPELV